ncbi:ferrous iron transport protein A [Sphingobium sp. 10 DY56-G10]|uniref:Ferrous iron transport protein A n=1 Tax=Sphingobium soli TaxID=1591116 RepID=A0ABS8H6R4_9SPHN|nr:MULTISPECIES: FeoA family protein [Sphingomonadaceae]EAT07547.1 FeoA [Sphingomonas sp. SKA58]MAP45246.1 ferrous iron transport protein A [Sphingobium sp.]MCC4234241.1 ferrous iron transport protein A [Sphingobium soli]
MRLTDLPLRQPAYVDLIDWTSLPASDAQRLREFGLCEGASVEALHHGGLLGRGPIACRVGRMTIAMRRAHAAAVTVRTGPETLGSELGA